jgi:hypothetical protein
VTLTARDGTGAFATATFTWTVVSGVGWPTPRVFTAARGADVRGWAKARAGLRLHGVARWLRELQR